MVRNIIFDMGYVLIRFEPEYFIERLGVEGEADRQLLPDAILHSHYWPLLDMGELTENELERRMCSSLPVRLHTLAHQLIFDWDQPIEPIPGIMRLSKVHGTTIRVTSFYRECLLHGLHISVLCTILQKEQQPLSCGMADLF